jgi:hypothetical protein
MNVKEKIGFLECSNNYNKYLLECIKDHFASENLYKKWSIKCDGTGQCFTNVPGTNIFYRYKGCKHDCKLEKCPNFTLCNNYVPKIMLDEYYDLCYLIKQKILRCKGTSLRAERGEQTLSVCSTPS